MRFRLSRSPLFWCGFAVFAFLLWGWQDTTRHRYSLAMTDMHRKVNVRFESSKIAIYGEPEWNPNYAGPAKAPTWTWHPSAIKPEEAKTLFPPLRVRPQFRPFFDLDIPAWLVVLAWIVLWWLVMTVSWIFRRRRTRKPAVASSKNRKN